MTQNDDFDSWFAGGEHKETLAYISHCLSQLKIVHMMQKLENQMLFCKLRRVSLYSVLLGNKLNYEVNKLFFSVKCC